jgi:hypothetical protein
MSTLPNRVMTRRVVYHYASEFPQGVDSLWESDLSETDRPCGKRVASKHIAAHRAVGEEVYLDREQARHFRVDYNRKGTELVVAADTLLRSKDPHEGYDRHHVNLLKPLGGKTLTLKGKGRGWFVIESVI